MDLQSPAGVFAGGGEVAVVLAGAAADAAASRPEWIMSRRTI
jgi:hypothetical protein